jgi:hypothetical protein
MLNVFRLLIRTIGGGAIVVACFGHLGNYNIFAIKFFGFLAHRPASTARNRIVICVKFVWSKKNNNNNINLNQNK